MSSQVSLHTTLGALEVGILISLFLFGVATVQVASYYNMFPLDPWYMKVLVGSVWFLDLGHTSLISYLLYSTTIAHYGNPKSLEKLPSLNATILFGALITLIVQVFLTFRVWKIMNRSFIGILCWTISLSRFIGSIVAGAEAFKSGSVSQFAIQWGWLITTVLVASASVDVIIAVSLCYFLMAHRGTSSPPSTTRVVDHLVTWTLQTGLMTSIAAVSLVICFQTMRDNFIWIAIYMFLGKLYSNSLVASLNARITFRNAMTQNCSNLSGSDNDRSPTRPHHHTPAIAIGMTQTRTVTSHQIFDKDLDAYTVC